MTDRYYTGVHGSFDRLRTGPVIAAPESRARVTVAWFTFLLAFVTYLDRVCISAAAPYITDELHLTTSQMGVALSAFALAYAVFEIPSGWLADMIGPRKVLTRIVLWWSAFTMLTATARGYASLVAIRFLFGAGEAGALPSASNCVARWFPLSERGKANGALLFGTRVGGMVAVPLVLQIITRWGWRASFVVVGAVGLVWAAAWWVWYRDSPAEHPSVSKSELAWINRDHVEQDGQDRRHVGQEGQDRREGQDGQARTPWRALLTSPNLWAICAMYFTYGYGLYFYFTWLPTYLIRELGFSITSGGLLAGLPFLCAGIANLTGGWLTDRLARTHGLRVARCGLGFASFFTGGVLTLASTAVPQPMAKAILLAAALGTVDLALSACWAVCLDIGRSHAGVVTGCMNTFSNLGGVLTPLVVAYAVERWQSWTIPFYVTAVVYVAGAFIWLVIDPTRPITK
jgi:MFS transporter, ACS family, glucarate transporter